jgi:hypothetical protein
MLPSKRLTGPPAESLLREIISIENPLLDYNQGLKLEKLDSLHIAAYAHFGNHFYSAVRAIEYTRYFGLQNIYIDDDFLQLPNNATLECENGIKFIHAPREALSNRLMGNFIISPRILQRLDFHAMEPCRIPFHTIVFPNLTASKDVLFIHIRSGDLFATSDPPVEYAQPPIGYYSDVMKMRNWSRIVLCAMDRINPCVMAVKNLGAEYENRSLMQDLTLLFSAEYLAIGRGTFGVAIHFLSLHLKTLYTFSMDSSLIGKHWNCLPDDEYKNGVMQGWYADGHTYKQMLKYGCKGWVIVEEGSNDDEPMHYGMG